MSDRLQRFVFEQARVRGELVRLDESWREVRRRREYPEPLRAVLGELTAASVLLAATVKFQGGALVLQVQGGRPVDLLVVECQADLSLRAMARWDGPMPAVGPERALHDLAAGGRCAITIDPGPKHAAYQGVVPLEGRTTARVLERYMARSEQIETLFALAASDERAAGLLLQRMPLSGAGNLGERDEERIGRDEDFNRIALLGGSVTRDELLGLDIETLLRRLFWQENLRRFAPRDARFRCACSRERVSAMLFGLGRAEMDDILAERGEVEVGCDFCGLQYRYDPVDIGELFTPSSDQQRGPSTLQ